MRAASSIVVSVFLISLCAGCGGDPPAPASGGGDAGQPGGAATPAPLKGSGLSKASELVGRWFALTESDFPAIEFMKDGKAIGGDDSGGLTFDYTVLEGGRLSLAAQGGATMIFDVTIAGDQLELRGKASLITVGGTQRFRRLEKNETVDAARKKKQQEDAKAYQERVASLEAFLKQPGLVLSVAESGPGAPPAIALELTQAAGSFSGKAWQDDKPPHLDAISGQLVLDPRNNATQVTVSFGQRMAPPLASAQGGGGQVTLLGTGSGKSFRLANKVTYGQGGSSFEMSLRSDPKLHAEVVQRFDAELARIESLKAPMVNLLKEYAVLRGRLQPMAANLTPPDSIELVLARDSKSGQYRCEGLLIGARGRGEVIATGAAEIAVTNDKPLLHVVCPPMRQLFLSVADEKAGKLSGEWQNMGQGQGKGAQLDVVEALDAAARDARLEARRKVLKSLGADSVFTGLAFEDSGLGLELPIAFRLQITVKPDGTVQGKAEYPSMATVMSVGGQIAETVSGPRLQLIYTASDATQPDQIFLRSIKSGSWSLAAADGAGPLKLTGCFAGQAVRATTLIQMTEESKAQVRKKLMDAFKDGGRFHLTRCKSWQVPGQTPTVVEWKLDEASSKVTGRIVIGGRQLEAFEKAKNTYEGELKEKGGWLALNLVQVSQLKANDKFVTELELFCLEDSNGLLYLSGTPTNIGRVVDEKPMSQRGVGYPVDFIPLAAVDAEARAVIDKTMADQEKAAADASAQAAAQQKAAEDATRAKFAPFAAHFQSPNGAVILADLPAEMSSVVLEAQVDTEKSTLSGRGTDLRELPFREFTFQGNLDARGQLSLTTSLATAPLVFNSATEKGLMMGRALALTPLPAAQRAKLNALIELGKRLASASPQTMTVETLNAATAKTREAALQASDLPGICLYQKRKNDQVAAMFTVKANGKFRWAKEPISLRLTEPLKGKGLYIKGGLGPTDNLTVVINGVHTATISAMERLGGTVVALPPDLEILDISLQAGGTAQARGVVLLK